jgi:hypothetical protein
LQPFVLKAQDEEPPPEPNRRMEEYRKVKLLEAIKLTDEQLVKLMSREKEFRESFRQHAARKKEAIERLRSLVDKKVPDDEINRQILAVVRIRNEQQERFLNFLNSLRDILSTRQIAQYVIFQEDFAKAVRRLLDNMREHHKGDRFGPR